jgi:hypothetical protein
MDLLRRLVHTQDSVTHYNEKGAPYEETTKQKIQERDELMRRIVSFVDERVRPVTVWHLGNV